MLSKSISLQLLSANQGAVCPSSCIVNHGLVAGKDITLDLIAL